MNISKLTLGSAQLGMDYGIANETGKPSLREANEILKMALHNGINCIDTAPTYGDSEERIGNYLSKHPSKCIVVTKLPEINTRWSSLRRVYPIVKLQIEKSMRNLRMAHLPIVLVHNANQMGIVYESLLKLKDERKIGMIGVSVYTVEELKYAMEFQEVEAVQMPINLFDHRFIPYLPQLKDKIVFARSIFLQGLLFAPYEHPLVYRYIEKLHKIGRDHETNSRDLAVSFVNSLQVTSLVIGTNKASKVLDNVELIKNPPLPENLMDLIYQEFADMPLDIIDPRRWK